MAGKAANALPAGSLHIEGSRVDPSAFYWAAHFHWEGRQIKRRLGPAHVELRRDKGGMPPG